MYSTEEKIQMCSWYQSGFSFQRVADMFAVEYPNRPIPNRSTIYKIWKQFKNTGCLDASHKKTRRTRYVSTDDLRMNVVLALEEDKHLSLVELGRRFEVSKTTIFKILKEEGYKSYKFENHQELFPRDCESRSSFCEIMQTRINDDPDILSRICFTDESTFTLHRDVNPQNYRYWSRDNLHLFRETRTQFPQKVNVWAGIINSTLIGPFFIEGTLNGDKYLELLRTQVIPAIEALNLENVWFQHDGAPPHSTVAVTRFLNNLFPNRWIGRLGPTAWPPRSPDLSLEDFFVGTFKEPGVQDPNSRYK